MIGKSCVSEDVLSWLAGTFSNDDYRSFLEVGTFDGVTISLLAQFFPEKRFIAVDDFSEGDLDNFMENNKFNRNVKLRIGQSHQMLWDMISEGQAFDVIFIDGEHTYPAVQGDFKLAYTLLRNGGTLVFHDRTHPEIRKAIEDGCVLVGKELKIFDEFLGWIEK